MNKLDVNQVGGFPLTTRILDELQKISAVFNGLGGIAGDRTILSGCELTGSTVSDGFVYVNNEVFLFKGGLQQTKVIIKEDTENLIFENNESKTVIRTRYVTFGIGVDSMDWADFKRVFQSKDIAAALTSKTDKTLFDALSDAFALVYAKMLTIEEGAEKNVQADFEQTDEEAPDYIKNKSGLTYLHKGTYVVGDAVSSDSFQTVTFPNVGTNNYMVLGSLVSNGGNFDNDNDVIKTIRDKQNSSFKLLLRELGNTTQDLSFDYVLIPL